MSSGSSEQPNQTRLQMDQAIKQRWTYRIGAAALSIGAPAGQAGNLLHPAASIGHREHIAG